jgi:hypothetical protein
MQFTLVVVALALMAAVGCDMVIGNVLKQVALVATIRV